MADIEDRHAGLVRHPLEEGKDLGAARAIELRQRLVHQEDVRDRPSAPGRSRRAAPRRRRATPAAACRKASRPSRPTTESKSRRRLASAGPAAVKQVGADGEMRKEPRLLEHHADASLAGGEVDAAAESKSVRPFSTIRPCAGARRPATMRDDRRLAGAGAAEERGHARACLERDVEREIAAPVVQLDRRGSNDRPSVPHPSRQDFGKEERAKRDHDRDEAEPDRLALAAGHLQRRCRSAVGIVCVSPGMLETKVMVAPNSPSALAKPSTAPASRPGHDQRQRDRREDDERDARRGSPRRLPAAGRPPRSKAGWRARAAESP